MAIEVIGNPKDVQKYREYLHRQGLYTKRFFNNLKKNGYDLAPKPEGFRTINTGIKSVYGENKKSIFEEDQKLYIAGIANENIIDRMDERLDPSGVNVENFMRNQVLLVDHLYISSATVGRVFDLKTEADGVHFEAYIGDPQKAPLTKTQQDVRSLVAQKLLQTVSVGFIPHKIQAPTFDDEGRLVDPAVILAWELLELSIVAVPANPGAVFDLKDLSLNDTNSSKTQHLTNRIKPKRIESKQEDNKTVAKVYELIFGKGDFTKEEAIQWAKDNDYKSSKVRDEDEEYRLEQRDVKDFEDGSFKTIALKDSVKAVTGNLTTAKAKELRMEEKILELLEQMKTISTILGSLGDSLKTISEKNETILGKLDSIDIIDSKGSDKEDEKEEKEDMDEEEEKGEGSEEEEEEEDENEEKIMILQDSVKTLTEKVETISEALLKVLERSNG